ncbi:O-antigen ligase family protein [Candidatus Latescibacterota bacterium]
MPVTAFGLGLLLILVPLVPFNFLSLPAGPLYALGPVLRFLPFGICAGVTLVTVLHRQIHMGRSSDDLAFLVWGHLVVAALAAVVGNDLPQSLARAVYYFTTGELLILLASWGIHGMRTVRRLIRLHVLCALVVSIYAVAEMLLGVNLLRACVFNGSNPLMSRFSNVAIGRAISTIGNPNPLGTYISMAVPFLLWSLSEARRLWSRVLWAAATATCLAALVLTFSRGAWIACAVAMATCFGLRTRSLAWAGVVVAGLLVWAVHSGHAKSPYDEFVTNRESYSRTLAYPRAIRIQEAAPLLGGGVGSFSSSGVRSEERNRTPDNMYLLTLAEMGVAGLALRVGLLVFAASAFRHVSGPPSHSHACEHLGPELRDGHSAAGGALVMEMRCVGCISVARAFLGATLAMGISMLSWDALSFPTTRLVFFILIGLGCAAVKMPREASQES